jgi:hypothetical protein
MMMFVETTPALDFCELSFRIQKDAARNALEDFNVSECLSYAPMLDPSTDGLFVSTYRDLLEALKQKALAQIESSKNASELNEVLNRPLRHVFVPEARKLHDFCTRGGSNCPDRSGRIGGLLDTPWSNCVAMRALARTAWTETYSDI